MVFMEDSERAADLANGAGIDCGLHLNLTTPFSQANRPRPLVDHQTRIASFLWSHRLAQVVPNPLLRSSFEYVVRTQVDEFRRLFGSDPRRIDGHHHMHLCMNVLLQRLLPAGAVVRRNFSFLPGEKSWYNRAYRAGIDGLLARRHRMTDYFFALPPLETGRLQRIVDTAKSFIVELETHPVQHDEFVFLMAARSALTASGVKTATFETAFADARQAAS
jgi:predicted glycoside hydrolase/deacetylase ChbG (UPF0249 family)